MTFKKNQTNQIFITLAILRRSATNEWRGPTPPLSAWATQLRRNIAAVASRWRHVVSDLAVPGIEILTSRTCRDFLHHFAHRRVREITGLGRGGQGGSAYRRLACFGGPSALMLEKRSYVAMYSIGCKQLF